MKKDKAKRLYEEGSELYLQLFFQKHGYLMEERPEDIPGVKSNLID